MLMFGLRLGEDPRFIVTTTPRPTLSPRIGTLRGTLGELRPEPVREPLPPLKVYAPPSKGRYSGAVRVSSGVMENQHFCA